MGLQTVIFMGIFITGLIGGFFSRYLDATVAWLWSWLKGSAQGPGSRDAVDVEKCEPTDVPDVTVVENTDNRYYERNSFLKYPQRVRFLEDMSYRGGVIEWSGHNVLNGSEVVVISTGDFYGKGDLVGKPTLPVEYSCPPGYYMLPLNKVEKIDDFKIGDYCVIRKTEASKSESGGFIRDQSNESFVIHRIDKDFKSSQDSDDLSAEDYQLVKVPPPESEIISSEHVGPITFREMKSFCGRNKGIQGKGNSCYLDSLIFAFFAFSDAFDDILYAESDDKGSDYLEIVNTLRYEIVYPLRVHQFVSYHNVERLRQSIARQVNNDCYLTETRDISECLDVLFGQLLNVPPLVEVGHFVQDKVQFNGVYVVEVFNNGSIPYPTSEQLLRRSAVEMQFCLKTMTDCLFLQIAREDGRRVNVFPSIDIDLKDLCYDTTKVCTKCRCQATMQFWNASRDIGGTYFCDDCARRNELDLQEGLKLPEVAVTSVAEEDTVLTLVGVLCIERSHFNCFVRCGMEWVFFDSMRDQEAILNVHEERQQVNIPLVKEIPNFRSWLESAQRSLKSNSSRRASRSTLSAEDTELATRIFEYPSFFIYRKI